MRVCEPIFTLEGASRETIYEHSIKRWTGNSNFPIRRALGLREKDIRSGRPVFGSTIVDDLYQAVADMARKQLPVHDTTELKNAWKRGILKAEVQEIMWNFGTEIWGDPIDKRDPRSNPDSKLLLAGEKEEYPTNLHIEIAEHRDYIALQVEYMALAIAFSFHNNHYRGKGAGRSTLNKHNIEKQKGSTSKKNLAAEAADPHSETDNSQEDAEFEVSGDRPQMVIGYTGNQRTSLVVRLPIKDQKLVRRISKRKRPNRFSDYLHDDARGSQRLDNPDRGSHRSKRRRGLVLTPESTVTSPTIFSSPSAAGPVDDLLAESLTNGNNIRVTFAHKATARMPNRESGSHVLNAKNGSRESASLTPLTSINVAGELELGVDTQALGGMLPVRENLTHESGVQGSRIQESRVQESPVQEDAAEEIFSLDGQNPNLNEPVQQGSDSDLQEKRDELRTLLLEDLTVIEEGAELSEENIRELWENTKRAGDLIEQIEPFDKASNEQEMGGEDYQKMLQHMDIWITYRDGARLLGMKLGIHPLHTGNLPGYTYDQWKALMGGKEEYNAANRQLNRLRKFVQERRRGFGFQNFGIPSVAEVNETSHYVAKALARATGRPHDFEYYLDNIVDFNKNLFSWELDFKAPGGST